MYGQLLLLLQPYVWTAAAVDQALTAAPYYL
jgi:hypothetical protein